MISKQQLSEHKERGYIHIIVGYYSRDSHRIVMRKKYFIIKGLSRNFEHKLYKYIYSIIYQKKNLLLLASTPRLHYLFNDKDCLIFHCRDFNIKQAVGMI
jgi:hypothetical protein